jgi:peptidoglycan/xylan/chitin deacetylase (PgdA/CDA1 family)
MRAIMRAILGSGVMGAHEWVMLRFNPARRALLGALLVSPLGLPTAQSRPRVRPWPNGARAAVSLTYDDGLDSQLENVVPELEARGLKGTFFLVQENVDARIADWVKTAALGHEIGNHTVSHPCTLGPFTEAAFAQREIVPMEAYLDSHFGASHRRIFAYPCGYLGLGRGAMAHRFGRYRQAIEDEFLAARTVTGEPNDPALAFDERLNLNAFEPTYVVDSPAPAARYLRTALARGAWAILVFHEVFAQRMGEGDTSIATHARILDMVQDDRFWCAPMSQVFTHITAGRTASA